MIALALLPLLLTQDPALVRGRLVDANGAPVVGARFELTAHPSDPELAATWQPPEARVGERDGTFGARFQPPGVPVAGVIVLPSGDRLTWTWPTFAPGETVDLGDVRLPGTATVAGRIVTADGEVRTDGWSVHLDIAQRLPSGARMSVVRQVRPSAESGEFAFVDVPAVPLRVRAEHHFGFRVRALVEEVSVGGEAFVELRYEGPDPERFLVVELDHPMVAWTSPQPLVARSRSGVEHRTGGGDVGGKPAYLFFDVEPGSYALALDDPRFVLDPDVRVETGTRNVVPVRGSAALRLDVTLGEDGPPLARYGARLLGGRGRAWELLRDGALAPPRGRVAGLVPTSMELEVRPPGREPIQVPIHGLRPGEERRVRIVVPELRTLTGRLVDPAGLPLAGATVEWTRGARAGIGAHGAAFPFRGEQVEHPALGGAVVTDADGVFALETTLPVTLRALTGPLCAEVRTVERFPGEPLEWTLARGVSLSGRVLLPAGLDPAEHELAVHLQAPRDSLEAIQRPTSPLDREGRFTIDALPLRRAVVGVRLPSGRVIGRRTHDPRAGGFARLELDLRETYPARLSLGVTVDGAPAEEGRIAFEGASRVHAPAGPPWDAHVPAGTWRVTARSEDDEGWLFDSGPLVLTPGERRVLNVRLRSITRRVRVLDREGRPRGDTIVPWRQSAGELALSGRLVTDARGYSTLTRTPGAVRFGAADGTGIEWCADLPEIVSIHLADDP